MEGLQGECGASHRESYRFNAQNLCLLNRSEKGDGASFPKVISGFSCSSSHFRKIYKDR